MGAPDPRSPFCTAYRLLALLLVATATGCWRLVPGWTVAVCLGVGLLCLLRVPRRLRLLEVAGAFLVLGAWGAGWALVVPSLLALSACLVAPEVGLARLNGMDRFMLVQEYPGNVVNSHQIIDTDRPLERSALEGALDSLMDEVPLLRSFVREGALSAERFFTRRPWVRASDLVVWSDDPRAEERWLQRPFDLWRRPPLRLLVCPRVEGGWRTAVSVHHSLCDGTGQVLLFDALMRRYAALLCGDRPEPAPELTRHPLPRLRELLSPRGPGWLWRMIRRHVRPADKIGVVNASLLEDEGAAAEPNVARQMLTLEREETQRLWEAAKAYRATPNHLYLAAALRAADAWRRARGLPERMFRVLTPADLRPLLGVPPGLGNYAGVINIDATPAEVRGEGLLESIQRQLKKARDLEEVIEAPINLGVTSLLLPLPHFRRELRAFDASRESFFFSFGYSAVVFPPELCLPGDVDVERMWMQGSPAQHPGFGLGPVRDRQRVHIVACYRRPLLTDEGCADFLRRFREELEAWVASAPARGRRRRAGDAPGGEPEA